MLKVQEMRVRKAVTMIALCFIKGEIILSGIIVPIVDKRIKYRLGKHSRGKTLS